MQIVAPTFTAEVRTPIEYPDSYDPSWRWLLANNLAATPEEERNKRLLELDDEYVTMTVSVILSHLSSQPIIYNTLRGMCSNPDYADDPRVLVERARRIYEDAESGSSSTAYYLEALLLCFDADMKEVCKRLPLGESLVLYYEKVFYNCRDNHTWKAAKVALRRHLALGGAQTLPADAGHKEYWRYTGAIHGCQLLYNEWGWCIEEGGVAIAAAAKSLQQVTLNNARRISEAGETPRQAQAAMIDVVGRLLEVHAAGELDDDQQRVISLLSKAAPTMQGVAAEDFDEIGAEVLDRLATLSASSKNSGETAGMVKDDHMRRQLQDLDK